MPPIESNPATCQLALLSRSAGSTPLIGGGGGGGETEEEFPIDKNAACPH
jgi:hypothetical protein